MKHLTFLLTSLGLLAASVSCGKIGGDDAKTNPYKPLELSSKSVEILQKGHSFSLEFIDRVDSSTGRNYVISPLSMQFLLGMILNGANGATADEICTVLGYGRGEREAVNEFCYSLLSQLPQMDNKTDLGIANALFADKSLPVLYSYKTAVGKYYRPEIANLDFSDSRNSLNTINRWCSDNTKGMIANVLDELSPNVSLYLFNALYFKGIWSEKFDKSATAGEIFTYESGRKDRLAMMKQNEEHTYNENDVFQAVSLAYGNSAFSMTVLLPRQGYGTSDIIASLKESGWDAFRSGLHSREVDLWLPKFEISYKLEADKLLSEMGMPSAFDGTKADFSALSENPLFLQFVNQNAVIKVDEEGTEAAAVTDAGFGEMAPPPIPSATFHADHPFLYLITERGTGAILFAGKFCGE